MKLEAFSKIVYLDYVGNQFDTKVRAEESNHNIHLKFRKYIEEELIVTFSSGEIDRLATTKMLWDNLEFTPSCIKKYYNIMNEEQGE